MEMTREKLIEEMKDIINQLDTEGLSFLMEQASVLQYNMEVRKRNESHLKEQEANIESNKTIEPKKKKPQAKAHVSIEQLKDGKFFHICIGSEKLFMDYKEIRSLYEIAKKADSPEQAGRRMFRWFKEERNDVLLEGNISSNNSIVLFEIYKALLDKFTTN